MQFGLAVTTIFEPLLAVIEVLSGQMVVSQEVATADRLGDGMDCNDFERVENFRSR